MRKNGFASFTFAFVLGLTACAGLPSSSGSRPADSYQAESTSGIGRSSSKSHVCNGILAGTEDDGARILTAYFSRTGSTAEIAGMIHMQAGGDLVRIETEEPYPEEYGAVLEQARAEQQADFRPALAARIDNMDDYTTIFLGYPIWHGDVPMAILTFLESYDWNGKTVIPFCTHGSGGAYDSFTRVANAAPGAVVEEGLSIAGGAAGGAAGQVGEWLEGLGLGRTQPGTGANAALNITIGNQTLTATLADNSSAEALRVLLAEGPLTLEMRDYAGMEKVGDLGVALPTNDAQMATGPGDLVLYEGRSFVIYYAANSWSLTPLGRIDDMTGEQLEEVLGTSDVRVILSLDVRA